MVGLPAAEGTFEPQVKHIPTCQAFSVIFFFSPSCLTTPHLGHQAHITISVLMKQGGGQLHRSWKPQLKGSRKIVCLTSVWPSLRWPLVLRFWNNSVYGISSHTAEIKGGKGRKPLFLFFSCELTLFKLLKADQDVFLLTWLTRSDLMQPMNTCTFVTWFTFWALLPFIVRYNLNVFYMASPSYIIDH